MSDDLRQLLHDTAQEPARPVDTAGVVRKAHRQKLGLRVVAGLASVIVVAGAAVALPRLWSDAGPQIVDRPTGDRVTAQIGLLDRPAGPDDELPDRVAEELEVDPEAAATARLARRSPGRSFYVYADDTQTASQGLPGPAVCVAVVYEVGSESAQACGPQQVPTPAHALVVAMSDYGTVGIVPDGVATAGEVVDADQLPDVPVVNNLFIDPAPPGNTAMEGRSSDAFCAVAPRPDIGPASLTDTDDPMELLESMATTAPVDVADDVYLVWDFLRVRPDAIQGDDVEFSEPVQQTVDRVDAYIAGNCTASAETATAGSVVWDGAATGSARLTETLRADWDPRGSFVWVRVADPDGVTLEIRGQTVNGRLDPSTRTINFLLVGQSFHANEVPPFKTEPPGRCTVVFDTLTPGTVDGEIDCTLTTPEGDDSVQLTGTFTTQ